MASTLIDLGIMTPSSAFGTSTTIPLGAAATVNGVTYLSFASAGATGGQQVSYSILDTGASEIGTATYNSSNTTLTSRTPTKSTNGNAAIVASSAALIIATVRGEDLNSFIVAGQLLGTATNDNAASGNVGEYFATASGADNASSTVTITIATPAVVTWTGHGFTVGAATTAIKFTTTGALPTGITSGTTYYVKAIDANTFNIATTADNALAGTFVATSGTQSGTHTGDIRVTMAGAGTNQNLAAFQLGAGDWEVDGQVLAACLDNTTSVTFFSANFATVSAATDRTWGRRLSEEYGGIALGATEFNVFNVGPARFSFSTTTTIYCVASHVFSGGTGVVSSGWLRARRAR